VLAAVFIAAVAAGIFAGRQRGLAVVLGAIVVSGLAYTLGVGVEGTTRWSRSLYGNDP
jgi:hypothetical protein